MSIQIYTIQSENFLSCLGNWVRSEQEKCEETTENAKAEKSGNRSQLLHPPSFNCPQSLPQLHWIRLKYLQAYEQRKSIRALPRLSRPATNQEHWTVPTGASWHKAKSRGEKHILSGSEDALERTSEPPMEKTEIKGFVVSLRLLSTV